VLRNIIDKYLTNAQMTDFRAGSGSLWKALLDLERVMVEVGVMLDKIEGQRCEEDLRDRQVWKKDRFRKWRVKGGKDGDDVGW
jgi:hypothetical protein